MDNKELTTRVIKTYRGNFEVYRFKDSGGYWKYVARYFIKEHVLIYENFYKCCLLPGIHIHHINGDKLDNRIENLMAVTKSQHTRIHHKGKTISEENKLKLIESHVGKPTRPHTEEEKEKIRQSVTKWWETHTRPMSQDARDKISEYQTGQIRSTSTRQKMSNNLLGNDRRWKNRRRTSAQAVTKC